MGTFHLMFKSAYLLLRRATLAEEEGKVEQQRHHLTSFVGLVKTTMPRCARVESAFVSKNPSRSEGNSSLFQRKLANFTLRRFDSEGHIPTGSD
jgi:hypothetical protein